MTDALLAAERPSTYRGSNTRWGRGPRPSAPFVVSHIPHPELEGTMMRRHIAHAVVSRISGLRLPPWRRFGPEPNHRYGDGLQRGGAARGHGGGGQPGAHREACAPLSRTRKDDMRSRTCVRASTSVTFTLTGFSPFVRDGLTLPSDFTATVNAELRVGALEETVTVSGQAPVVDVQSTQRTTVMSRELIDSVPTGRTFAAVGARAVGIRVSEPNVGGARTGIQQRLWPTAACQRTRPSTSTG